MTRIVAPIVLLFAGLLASCISNDSEPLSTKKRQTLASKCNPPFHATSDKKKLKKPCNPRTPPPVSAVTIAKYKQFQSALTAKLPLWKAQSLTAAQIAQKTAKLKADTLGYKAP